MDVQEIQVAYPAAPPAEHLGCWLCCRLLKGGVQGEPYGFRLGRLGNLREDERGITLWVGWLVALGVV